MRSRLLVLSLPLAVLLPYRRDDGGRVAYAELVATRAEPAVFAG